ncbi:MAG: ABC transporter substrate-binding protein [Planctomycetota bacterium]
MGRARPGRLAPIVLVALAGCAGPGGHEERDRAPASPVPAFRLREGELVYPGPGREIPPPVVPEVKLGWFGPSDPADPAGGDAWIAACLAVEEANRAGGLHGTPFRLVPAWSASPWGSAVAQVTRLVYDEGVWAIAGSPDGPSAHLVEQVTAKARLAFVDPSGTDSSTTLAGVPWMFALAPGDQRLAPDLARTIVDRARGGPIALVSGTDHDSRLAAQVLAAALDKLAAAPAAHFEFTPGAAFFARQIAGVRESGAAALGLVAPAGDGGRLLGELRAAGVAIPVVAGPRAGRREFLIAAGAAAEGTILPLLWNPQGGGEAAAAFRARFAAAAGHEPDYSAALAYDAVSLVVAAVRRSGLNRALLRDALRALSPWPGVAGEVRWDPTGQNTRAVPLGIVRGGRLVALD